MSDCAMPTLETGASIGVYRIECRIGSGGMGEVYRAIDTRLHRRVAIKVLPAVYATDREWLARFQREARVLASLNHPNITSIYGLEESDGICALAMELAEGPTLAGRMASGPISVQDALALAKQIAEALEYAHDRGIVHRDLKPANVKITPEGEVKVLDFGLARAAQPVSPADPAADDATVTATRAGAVLGTPGYMSPEQATGAPLDRRADIWAFGVVLFEMLTGRRLYRGASVTEALAASIRDEPRWDELPGETPAAIRRLLKRSLEKDPKRRLRDIGEARIALEDCLAGKPDIQEPQPVSKRRLPGWAVAAVLVAAVAAGGMGLIRWRFPAAPIPAQPVRYQISLPADFKLPPSQGFSLSPDGRTLAFLANSARGSGVWVKPMNALEPRFLPGTDLFFDPPAPFWSPDSKFLVFKSADGKLKKVDLIGSPPVEISSRGGGGGAWSRAGVIVFGTMTTGLLRIPENGGDPVPLTVLDAARGERIHGGPTFLPDGRHFVYSRASWVVENSGIYVGSLDAAPSEQSLKRLVATPYFAQVVAQPDGNASLLFLRDGTLWMQELDTSRLALTGDPLRVADPIGNYRARGFFSAPAGDALIYQDPRELPQMTWFDRKGKRIADVGAPVDLDSPPALSPDGTRLALLLFDSARINLWTLDLARGMRTRLTVDAALQSALLWSPDSKRLVFSSARGGHFDLYQMAASGEGSPELLYSSNEDKAATSWSPDGQFLAYETQSAATGRDIWILPLGGTGKSTAVLRSNDNEASGSFCPTGRWFAYESDYSGRREVYIKEFSPATPGYLTGPRIPVSTGGGFDPHWRSDGKELFYVAPDYTLMSVALPPGPALKPGVPERLFSRPPTWLGEADSDGKRFLFAVPKEQSVPQPFTVVLNWQAELRK
jgi:serine/threonine protein kinase/Tol biopolymer transport system component